MQVTERARPGPDETTFARGTLSGADFFAVLFLLVVTVGFQRMQLSTPSTPYVGDISTFFAPMFAFLGDQLRQGNVPGWNPYQFSGAPFAADPQSGWTYLPAMLFFTWLPVSAAMQAFMLFHLLLAGITSYALGRLLGFSVAGGLAAAIVFEFTSLWQRTVCCPQVIEVVAWIPLALLCTECALRSASRLSRLGWLLACGFVIGQLLAAWLGQGSYYSLLIIAGFLVYRILLVPVNTSQPILARARDLFITGTSILVLGALFDASGVLPRLFYNLSSNVAGGAYQGQDANFVAEFGGWDLDQVVRETVGGYKSDWWYAGSAAVLLAVLAPVTARRWPFWPFFASCAALMVILALRASTPVSWLASHLLPMFDVIHSHYRERVTYALTLPVALLVGASVTAWSRAKEIQLRVALATGVVIGLVAIDGLLRAGSPPSISAPAQAAIFAAGSLVIAAAIGQGLTLRLLPIALILVLLWEPTGRILSTNSGGFGHTGVPVDLATYQTRAGAAEFLAAQPVGSYRYFGFDPGRLGLNQPLSVAYLGRQHEVEVLDMLAISRASLLELYDIQGYNPVHPQRYVEFVDALNGRSQPYWFTNVYPSGLKSPLLNLLNARYIVLPHDAYLDDPEVAQFFEESPVVYQDPVVRVHENMQAFPRAWLVHEARRVQRGEALTLLSRGDVDARHVALLETEAPTMGQPVHAARDSVTLVEFQPDEIVYKIESEAGGLLIASEIYDPGWQATVDARPIEVLVANHALLAIPVEAGSHTVHLSYEPPFLRIGMVISALAFALASMVWLSLLARRLQRAWNGSHRG